MTIDPNLLNTLLLLLISAFTAFTSYQNAQNRAAIAETLGVAKQTEINTNSMKDALVLATSKVSHAEGKAEGIQFQKDKQS